ncbi:MAG: acetyltransferase [Spirochaetaceae bacterium]|nr:acetyltransferase [Spirochaetaceae bacterium]
MKDIILIGGGGHCISCIDVIEASGLYRIQGILDLPQMVGRKVLDYSIIGTDDELASYIDNNTAFCITIGQVEAGDTLRKNIYIKALNQGADLPAIISHNSYVSKRAEIENGSVVLSGVIVNSTVKIGNNSIINSGSIVEHGAFVGDHCHISTGVIVNGDCIIGNNCFIGSGAIIKNGVSIVENALVGMGSVVRKNITAPGTYYGNPLRKIK